MRKIGVGSLEINKEEKRAVNKVLSSGRISEGFNTHNFEKKWSEYIGVKYCVAVSSGTAALITALTALKYLYKLEKRPKVITSPLTYISDANAIVLSGFEPLFVDIEEDNFCISPDKLQEHLKNADEVDKYSIIIPVDLMGYSVNLDKIKEIADEYNLIVLEDACQAHGTVYQGYKCGSQAVAGVFSFYIAHNIQAGEMGAITTNNFDIYNLARKIKANGRVCECEICRRQEGVCPLPYFNGGEDDVDPRFFHDVIGYNFKIMEFEAVIALEQLNKIDGIIKKRQENVLYLNSGLKEFENILKLPFYSPQVSYLAYPLVIKNPQIISRKELRCELEKRGIETRPLFGCIPTQQPAYAYLKPLYAGNLPNAEYVGRNGFYIGCHQYLNREDLDYVIDAFRKIILQKH